MPRKKGSKNKKTQSEELPKESEEVVDLLEDEVIEEPKVNEIEVLQEQRQELIDKMKADKDEIEAKLNDLQYQENIKILKEQGICRNCGTNLELDPEVFLEQGVGRKRITCPNCHMINRVAIRLDGPPTEAIAELTVSRLEFAWNVRATQNLTDDQIIAKLEDESRRIDKGRNKESPVVKALIKAVLLQQIQIDELRKKV